VVSALDALHAADWVHFDVKPANILVDRSGRAVLADFGLSTAIHSRAGDRARDAEGAGTLDYMGPERRPGGLVTPASDLYSVGAVILEALTGSPHDGHEAHDAYCDDPMLAIARQLMLADPEARPTAREAAAAFGTIAAASATVAHGPVEPPFVGRGAQLAALAAGFARVEPSTAVVGHVHGPSGIGKTALIQQFVQGVAARGDALVLQGRCHPYEQIAFGGLDRIVDGLADCVRDGELATTGIPASALIALVRLFPMLPWRIPVTMSVRRTIASSGCSASRPCASSSSAPPRAARW
jgi:eukaryotic-like serine/threonine-protein kinase